MSRSLFRKPSVKRSLKARTTGKVKRKIKKTVNPLYGKKGIGLLTNPSRSLKNTIYKRTSIGLPDIIKTMSKKSKAHASRLATVNLTAETVIDDHYNFTPAREYIMSSQKTLDGLWPHEIIIIQNCHRHSNPQRLPNYYEDDLGVAKSDVAALQNDLANRGFVIMGKDSKWQPTDLGKRALELNADIIYAHKHALPDLNIWNIQRELAAFPREKDWTGRLWRYLNTYIDKNATQDILCARNAHWALAELAEYLGRTERAEQFRATAEQDIENAQLITEAAIKSELAKLNSTDRGEILYYLSSNLRPDILAFAQTHQIPPFD